MSDERTLIQRIKMASIRDNRTRGMSTDLSTLVPEILAALEADPAAELAKLRAEHAELRAALEMARTLIVAMCSPYSERSQVARILESITDALADSADKLHGCQAGKDGDGSEGFSVVCFNGVQMVPKSDHDALRAEVERLTREAVLAQAKELEGGKG